MLLLIIELLRVVEQLLSPADNFIVRMGAKARSTVTKSTAQDTLQVHLDKNFAC